jgi:hypothetical protein
MRMSAILIEPNILTADPGLHLVHAQRLFVFDVMWRHCW